MAKLSSFKVIIFVNFHTQYIGCVEEAEWACEEMKKSGIPISISMCIGPLGDFNDVPVEEVGVRLAKAGEIKLDIETFTLSDKSNAFSWR